MTIARLHLRWALIATASGAWLLAVSGCAGSAANGRATSSTGPAGKIDTLQGQRDLTTEQLNDLTRSYADRFVALVVSADDDLRRGGDTGEPPSPAQRKRLQTLKVNCATAAYSIASQADPLSRVIDLVVLTTLESQYWIDDGEAEQAFGANAHLLIAALRRARVEALEMAARVMSGDQLELLDYLIWSWRRANPGVERVEFVRFADFATMRGGPAGAASAAAAAAARAEGLFASMRRAAAAVDETKQMLDRAIYILQRQPTLLRWQAETLKADIVATPEITRALEDLDRLTRQVELAPANIAAERQAVLSAFDDRHRAINESVTNVRGAVTDFDKAIVSIGQAGKSLTEMLHSADAVLARFDEYVTRHPLAPTTEPSRPFDVREYTDALKQLATTIDQMNQLVNSSNSLLGSAAWDRRMEQLNESADGRVRAAASQSQQLVDEVFRRAYVFLGLLLVVLVLYRIIASLLLYGLRRQAAARATGAGAGEAAAALGVIDPLPAAAASPPPARGHNGGPEPAAKGRMT
jgi:hypothetical protein